MRTPYAVLLIGAWIGSASLAAGQAQAQPAPAIEPAPWTEPHEASPATSAAQADPSVIAVSNPPIPVVPPASTAPGAECQLVAPFVGEERHYQAVWGSVDAKLFPDAGRVAPNGISYNPLFSLDMDFNIWLWKSQGLYLFASPRFWGGRGGEAGQTQGNIDYTRREFDMTSGLAWNYYGPLEVRAVGYDRENFNRGVSLVSPGGTTNDGDGIEQRLYLNDEYAKLGQEGFNISKANFVSLGYFPTKSMIGGDGIQYKPGLFAHLYLTYDLPQACSYFYLDLQQYFQETTFAPRMLYSDVGLAVTPFESLPMLEFRLGSEFNTDFNASGSVRNMSLPYLSVRYNF